MININDVPIEILKGVNWFVSGSVRFKTNKEGSDLDICICNDKRDLIISRIKGNISFSVFNMGFKFKTEKGTINIIPLHPKDYVCWFYTANIMEIMPMLKNKSKQEIHAIHEMLIGIVKIQYAKTFIDFKNYSLITKQTNSIRMKVKKECELGDSELLLGEDYEPNEIEIGFVHKYEIS